MKQRYRRGFSTLEKTALWDRWQRGESLKAFGRAFGKPLHRLFISSWPHTAASVPRHGDDPG
jgi:IS30 family transposase